MKWLIWLVMLAIPARVLADAPVQVGERATAADVDPDSERLVDFLTGGAVTASKAGTGKAVAAPNDPPWLQNWLEQARDALQPARFGKYPSQLPLLRVTPTVLTLDRQPLAAPVMREAVAWPQLVCPQGPAGLVLQVRAQTLQMAESGDVTLGLELACRQGNAQLLRAVRLIVGVDTRGTVRSAWGLRVAATLALRSAPDSEAIVAWPLQPAELGAARPAWALARAQGWLVQLTMVETATWTHDGGLPRIESEEPGALDRTIDLQRATLWLARDAKPLAVLLQGGVRDGRELSRPLPRESADDVLLGDGLGVHIHQRVAVQSGESGPRRAALLSWRLLSDRADLWPVTLPVLDVEGLWRCNLEADEQSLACHFQAAGTAVMVQVGDRKLQADTARGRWRDTDNQPTRGRP